LKIDFVMLALIGFCYWVSSSKSAWEICVFGGTPNTPAILIWDRRAAVSSSASRSTSQISTAWVLFLAVRLVPLQRHTAALRKMKIAAKHGTRDAHS